AVIELLLGHRRKKIKTCLASADKSFEQIAQQPPIALLDSLEKLGIDPHARGESLTPHQFVALANVLVTT
ncbi:unnamed protein product, partial [marine sediment metagenome]